MSETNNTIKIGLKSFVTVVIILLSIMILVGILTYIIPAGTYDIITQGDNKGQVVPDSYHTIDSTTTLPVWRWFTAPIEALLWGQGNVLIIQVIAVLLILGGTFFVLEKTGGIIALINILITKLGHRKYTAIWIITLVMMLFSSLFGLQEEMLILFPIFLAFAQAMNWSKTTAISLILLTTGVGFTAALFNPFTIGTASKLAGVSIADGIWYRLIILAVLYVFTCLFLVHMAKKDEKQAQLNGTIIKDIDTTATTNTADQAKKGKIVITLFAVVTVVMILSVVIPAIEELQLTMVFMGASFLIGIFVAGPLMQDNKGDTIKAFGKGMLSIAPAVVITLLAFSVKYIAEQGNILHTIFYHVYNFLTAQSPYIAVIIMYGLVLIVEFLIPGSTSKCLLLIPLLTLAPMPGISKNIIILAFLFGDGYTNVLFPTCGTLVIGLSIANVSFVEWIKKTGLFQLMLAVASILFLLLAVAIGL